MDGALFFVPVSAALGVAPIPRVTAVPGAPPGLVGVAMHAGTVVPVISIGSARVQMLLCEHGGEAVGLVGGEVVRTGVFDAALQPLGAIEFEGRCVEPLDVAAIYARVEAGARRGRWGG